MSRLASRVLLAWLLVAVTPHVSRADPAPEPPAILSYDEFARMTPEERHRRFPGLDPQNKAQLLRQHVETWLDQHRWRLSSAQIAVAEELRDLFFERFNDPNALQNPDFHARSDGLSKKLECRFRHSDLWTALGPMVPPLRSDWNWRNDLWTWIQHCVAPVVLK